MRLRKIIIGVWAGFVLGTTAALLFPPEKGSKSQGHFMDVMEIEDIPVKPVITQLEEPMNIIGGQYNNTLHLNFLAKAGKSAYEQPKNDSKIILLPNSTLEPAET